jgi:hypothetical protein
MLKVIEDLGTRYYPPGGERKIEPRSSDGLPPYNLYEGKRFRTREARRVVFNSRRSENHANISGAESGRWRMVGVKTRDATVGETYVLSGGEVIVLGEGGRRHRTRAFSSYFSYNRDNIAGSKNHIWTSGFRQTTTNEGS